jgi:hypothetical protein
MIWENTVCLLYTECPLSLFCKKIGRGIRVPNWISSRSHLISSIFNYILKVYNVFKNFNGRAVRKDYRLIFINSASISSLAVITREFA